MEGRFLFCEGWNFSKSVGPTFIREMRVPKHFYIFAFVFKLSLFVFNFDTSFATMYRKNLVKPQLDQNKNAT